MRTDTQRITRAVMVALGMDFGLDAVTGKEKLKSYVEVRHLAMWLCHRCLGLSYSEIGKQFGKRDHSTVMSAIRRVDSLVRNHPHCHYSLVAAELAAVMSAPAPGIVRCSGARDVALAEAIGQPDLELAAAE